MRFNYCAAIHEAIVLYCIVIYVDIYCLYYQLQLLDEENNPQEQINYGQVYGYSRGRNFVRLFSENICLKSAKIYVKLSGIYKELCHLSLEIV